MQKSTSVSSRPYFWLALVVLLGAALRLYQLGVDSFWVDEAGGTYAARMQSIPEMLRVFRSHVLAMPLDYVVAWLVAKFSTQEGVLRLPSALWGIASLIAAYPLYRRFVPVIPALLGVLVLEGLGGFIYQYFIQNVFANSPAAERLWVADWEDLNNSNELGGKVFVITPGNLAETQLAQLQAAGLVPGYQSDLISRYAKTLWVSQ